VAAGGVVLVALGVLVVPKVVRAVSRPVRGANAYLGLLRDGATDTAYGSLCSELRQQITSTDYAAALQVEEEQGGRLVSFNVYKSMVQFGGNTGLVEYRAKTAKGTLAMEARMIREDGQWHWCGSRPQPKSKGITVHFP
jgi:hypothetical protein